MSTIKEFIPIIGQSAVDELFLLGEKMQGKRLQNINSTAVGGGVAEILSRMIPLLREIGVDARWDVIKGDERFFGITKKIHNALHGLALDLTNEDMEYFREMTRVNAGEIDCSSDCVLVHDPQPVGLIDFRKENGSHWVWRGHVDFSNPHMPVWNFLSDFVEKYESAIFSAPLFARQLHTKQVLIPPSIDPLSDKNRELSEAEIDAVFRRFSIDRSRPVVTQISRFDYLKDPVGVIRAYRMVKRYVDVQLVLAGGGATDDPEGPRIIADVQDAAAGDKDIFVLLLPPASDIVVNALQRGSTIVLQKSLREGFGLTVAEALWKAKPVIASAVGGIPLQIAHKYSGILTHTVEGTAYWIKQLLNEPVYGRALGINGRDHIKNNFLMTRHIRDYLLAFLALFHKGDIVYL